MPHLILEFSENLEGLEERMSLLNSLHQILSKKGEIPIENCKSRIRTAGDFIVSNGNPQNAFVHLEVRFLEGREFKLKQTIADALLSKLQNYFLEQNPNHKIQYTVHFVDMKKDNYFKSVSDQMI